MVITDTREFKFPAANTGSRRTTTIIFDAEMPHLYKSPEKCPLKKPCDEFCEMHQAKLDRAGAELCEALSTSMPGYLWDALKKAIKAKEETRD